MLILLPVLAYNLERNFETPSGWTLLIFLGALPLVNAIFDWLSLGFTRWLLRKGQTDRGWWPLLYALIDLAVAIASLFLVMICSLAYLQLLNAAIIAGGGNVALNVTGLLEQLRVDPASPAVWWVYVTIFTTFIPSLCNLVIGGLSLLRGIPYLSPWAARQFLPVSPVDIGGLQRTLAIGFFTLQFAIALVGAVLVFFLLIGFGLQFLQSIGFGLLDVADWVNSQIAVG